MIDTILQTLLRLWLFDVWVLSQWWLYAPLCIPAICYLIFMLLKWWLITCPIWLPISLICQAIRGRKSQSKEEDET